MPPVLEVVPELLERVEGKGGIDKGFGDPGFFFIHFGLGFSGELLEILVANKAPFRRTTQLLLALKDYPLIERG